MSESYKCCLENSRKSFSIVELAIYIVAVSILTGVAISGMEVVNNAKAQKIMDEMDSYRQAMYLFQSTFGILPGNVTQAACNDINELSNLTSPGNSEEVGTYCGATRTVITGNESLLATETSQNSFLNAMRFLVASGIKTDAARTNLYQSPLASGDVTQDSAIPATTYAYEVIKKTQGVSSFSADAAYSYVGFSGTLDGMAMIKGAKKATELSGSANIKKQISGKNVLVMYYNYADGDGIAQSGVVTPVMAKKVSLKFDNNTNPAEGKLLAIRRGQELSPESGTTVCYNGSNFVNSKDASSAGCNLIYVL